MGVAKLKHLDCLKFSINSVGIVAVSSIIDAIQWLGILALTVGYCSCWGKASPRGSTVLQERKKSVNVKDFEIQKGRFLFGLLCKANDLFECFIGETKSNIHRQE